MTVQSKCAAGYLWRGKSSNFSSYRELKILLHKVTELALWAPKYGMRLWFPCRYLHGVLLWSYSLFFKLVTWSRIFTFLVQWVCYYLTSLISGCPETSSLWYISAEQPPKGIPFFSECAVRGANECIGVILNCCSSKGCWGFLTSLWHTPALGEAWASQFVSSLYLHSMNSVVRWCSLVNSVGSERYCWARTWAAVVWKVW